METICSSHKSLYRDLPLYEDHKIRRAAAYSLEVGEVCLMDRLLKGFLVLPLRPVEPDWGGGKADVQT